MPEADQVGTNWKLLDTSASVANSYTYDAFGVARSASEAFSNPYRFAGKPLDADPDLYHFIARQYDPSTGHFLSPDPLPLREGPRPYSYVQQRPLVSTDPRGLLISHWRFRSDPTVEGFYYFCRTAFLTGWVGFVADVLQLLWPGFQKWAFTHCFIAMKCCDPERNQWVFQYWSFHARMQWRKVWGIPMPETWPHLDFTRDDPREMNRGGMGEAILGYCPEQYVSIPWPPGLAPVPTWHWRTIAKGYTAACEAISDADVPYLLFIMNSNDAISLAHYETIQHLRRMFPNVARLVPRFVPEVPGIEVGENIMVGVDALGLLPD